MKKAYINRVDEIWEETGYSVRCKEILDFILEYVKQDELTNYYIPWNPFAYGPQVGINDYKYERDELGNRVGVPGTGNKFVWVSPNAMRSSYWFADMIIDIKDLSVEEVKEKVKELFNKYKH